MCQSIYLLLNFWLFCLHPQLINFLCLKQTAFLRPKLKSKKVKKLYFSGQLTVPGPGVPPAIVSGKLVANIIKNEGII